MRNAFIGKKKLSYISAVLYYLLLVVTYLLLVVFNILVKL